MRIMPRETEWDVGRYCAIAVRHYSSTDHSDITIDRGLSESPLLRDSVRGPHSQLIQYESDGEIPESADPPVAAAAGGSAHQVAPDAAVDATAESPGRLAHTPAFA